MQGLNYLDEKERINNNEIEWNRKQVVRIERNNLLKSDMGRMESYCLSKYVEDLKKNGNEDRKYEDKLEPLEQKVEWNGR